MKKHTFFLLLALASIYAQAQIPSGYYNNAEGKSGNALKIALHDIIKGHTSISYNPGIWNAFKILDRRTDNTDYVWDIYSDIPNGTPKYFFVMGDKQCGSYNQEGDCYNREHSWPQSWFNEESTPKTDLHHIFPTDGKVNGERGNLPYGVVGNATWTSKNGSKIGSCTTSGYTGTVFEPIDAYKGDLARAYFYMSVRYYSEDSGWITSGMTNKSEILPWAMTMLLSWNELDPVSDKERNRNNLIYSNYQHNRNPFIDHPEYARMIWDPNYTPTTSYNITYASNLSNGSVSGPSSANEGSTVAIVATPNAGYQVSSYSVRMTASPYTAVTVSNNGTFTMPNFAVTVSATFTQNTTNYNITLKQPNSGGTIAIANNGTSALSGTTINLTATPSNGYSLYSWYVYKTGDINTIAYQGTTDSFTMPAYDVTVTASFVQGSIAYGDYVKVTSAPSDWSGDYLIVNESKKKAFNGGLTALDANGNTITVTITNNTITSENTTDAAKFTIAPMTGGGYSIKSASGSYIGFSGNNGGLTTSTTELKNTISLNGSDATIQGTGSSTLQYNSSADRFRYYSSSQQAIQLYKREVTNSSTTPTHTVHFEANNGTGNMSDQTVNEMEATALTQNAFTRTGYVFDGWNTAADGSGTYYADGATVTLLSDLTLYAQWEKLYTITLAAVSNGSINASSMTAVEETTITLTATPANGYELDHWTVTDANNNAITVTDNQFEMPASNVTVSASFVYVGAAFEQKYYLVTSSDQLVAGRKYLIVNTSAGKALGTTQNNNNRSAANVTISSNVIASIGNTVCELTLGGQNGAWTFFDANWNNGGYLYAAGGTGNNNYLKTQATLTDEGKWTITFDNNNNATIKTIATTVARHTIMYNNGSSIFSCYASGQQAVQLFILSEEKEYSENTTLAGLNTFDKTTITSGTILTANAVYGTSMCNEASNIIIEDGAQLIHSATDVKATMKKSITAYSGDGGWFTIATPFTSCTPSGTMISDDYDLYAYNEAGPKEWDNYKAGSFNLTAGSGYLYAHNPGTTLRMTGMLNSGNASKKVNLSYSNANASIKGYNLLGNPTAHDINFTKTANVSDGYYYLENGSTWIYTTSNTVPAGRGFLVKANATGQSVTLNSGSKRGEEEPLEMAFIRIEVDGETAFVKMTDGVSMPLLSFRGNSQGLYFSQDGNPYIMLVKGDNDNLSLHYKARENGTHTLHLSPFTSHLSPLTYLHLIDNLTGAEIDLLKTTSYSFESNTTDYEARFQLVFSENDNGGPNSSSQENEDFAFISNGELIISGTGTLQIIDVLGRMLFTKELSVLRSQFSVPHFTPGVYILRILNDNGIKTQKIVIP